MNESEKQAARNVYEQYQAMQGGFVPPTISISLEPEATRVRVYMDAAFKGGNYHFESVQLSDVPVIQQCLNSDQLVREKYADGKTRSLDQTTAWIKTLSGRYEYKRAGDTESSDLYSGFVVTDSNDGTFLGLWGMVPLKEQQKWLASVPCMHGVMFLQNIFLPIMGKYQTARPLENKSFLEKQMQAGQPWAQLRYCNMLVT